MDYRVTVERNKLKFAAAHFATFEGKCEPLHGHNYAVSIEVGGSLTDDSWVCDFSTLKSLGKALCDELDHKFLLQRDSRALQIDEGMSNWKVRFLERGFVFPKADVIAMPIDNTTAERLAGWFIMRLKDRLRERGASNLTAITVGIEEAPGQSGWASERFD
ncbi:MAG: 6-pyruvoyl tetrahydropterin synthase family protein [Chloroflexota bacterium]|nr:6-pyruvoyl tetrahydropterin synthase family protein [Chloroflexota bacterium]